MKESYDRVEICCICGKEYTHWGNNPWPLKNENGEDFGENDRCCDKCNDFKVIPARIERLQNKA